MLIEYYANDIEDQMIEKQMQKYHIDNWFNPEDNYYVIETQDDKILTILAILGIEVYVSGD